MPGPRNKFLRLHVESLGTSSHTPACEEVELVALFEAEDGSTTERRECLLAYHAILRDPEQLAPLLAGTLRKLMVEANRDQTTRQGQSGTRQI